MSFDIQRRRSDLGALILFVICVLLTSSAFAAPSPDNAWKDWKALLAKDCPRNHVDWTCDGCWLDLTGAFEQTQTDAIQHQIAEIADLNHACSQEAVGLSCEMARNLTAYKQLNLLQTFTTFACHAVKCEEPALCSRFPTSPPGQ